MYLDYTLLSSQHTTLNHRIMCTTLFLTVWLVDDLAQMRNILGITPRPADQTMIDMAYSMIERGFIKKTRKYRGHPIDGMPTSVNWNS